MLRLTVLAFRPFVNKGGLSDQERLLLKKRGERIGIVLAAFGILLGIFLKFLA